MFSAWGFSWVPRVVSEMRERQKSLGTVGEEKGIRRTLGSFSESGELAIGWDALVCLQLIVHLELIER